LKDNNISHWLSKFFVLHFIVDMAFAIPLFFFPISFLTLFGWQTVDPVMSRLVAAALFGIGIESWLGRNSSREAFKSMLNLKIIWSIAAIAGFLIAIIQGRANFIIWIVLFTFAAFNILWVYWRIRLK